MNDGFRWGGVEVWKWGENVHNVHNCHNCTNGTAVTARSCESIVTDCEWGQFTIEFNGGKGLEANLGVCERCAY